MKTFLKIIFIFIFITSCSLNKNSKFWSTPKKIAQEKKLNIEEIFPKEKTISLELNPNLKISLFSKPINKSFINNYDNNNGRINFDKNLDNISKFKFSKIEKFYQYETTLAFDKDSIIFFDNKGSILKFDTNSKLIWKKNYYSKREKKTKPILTLASNKSILVIADSIAKYYALDIATGEVLWSKKNEAPFNSQLKIYKDKIFVIDFQNTLRCYSIKDGSEIWSIKTENPLIKSNKKLSLVIVNDNIYFNNSAGDISSVNIDNAELIWQIPTQSSLIYQEVFSLKTSDLIADKDTLYLSNNKNQFFAIDAQTGRVKWKQNINAITRPTLVDNYIFTVSIDGYLAVIEKNSGKIIRITDVFKNYIKRTEVKDCKIKDLWSCKGSNVPSLYLPFMKKGKSMRQGKSLIKPTGFIVAKNNIYLTTDNGRLIVIETKTGKTLSIKKIDNDKISRPLVLNENLYIIKDNAIIRLN